MIYGDMREKIDKAKVKVIFTTVEANEPTWPYINYDVEARAKKITSDLMKLVPEIEFSYQVMHRNERETLKEMIEKEKGKYDGYMVYITNIWTQIPQTIVKLGVPVVVVDELFSGSGEFLATKSLVEKEKLPVVCVSSSNFKDVIETVKLFSVIKKMKQSKILAVYSDKHEKHGKMFGTKDKIEEIFGTKVEIMTSDELKIYYENTDIKEAEQYKNKWIKEAKGVVEPTEEEILKSAKMHLALKNAMKEKNADVVTVDCLNLVGSGKLPAYPCLSFFQLNNEGLTGVCEADLDSSVTQLLIRYLTERPAYVSDPVIDTATNQIIYAHCVATNKVYGPDGISNPYIIRSHAEDRKGASIQSFLPLGEKITTVKVSSLEKAFSIHSGKSVANIVDDKGCRTKLAAEVDAEKIVKNYHFEIFGWHRVTFYGDYREQLINLATLFGLEIYEEDT